MVYLLFVNVKSNDAFAKKLTIELLKDAFNIVNHLDACH